MSNEQLSLTEIVPMLLKTHEYFGKLMQENVQPHLLSESCHPQNTENRSSKSKWKETAALNRFNREMREGKTKLTLQWLNAVDKMVCKKISRLEEGQKPKNQSEGQTWWPKISVSRTAGLDRPLLPSKLLEDVWRTACGTVASHLEKFLRAKNALDPSTTMQPSPTTDHSLTTDHSPILDQPSSMVLAEIPLSQDQEMREEIRCCKEELERMCSASGPVFMNFLSTAIMFPLAIKLNQVEQAKNGKCNPSPLMKMLSEEILSQDGAKQGFRRLQKWVSQETESFVGSVEDIKAAKLSFFSWNSSEGNPPENIFQFLRVRESIEKSGKINSAFIHTLSAVVIGRFAKNIFNHIHD